MATGEEEKVGYSLANVGTLTLGNTDEFPRYYSIVVCQDKIVVLDWNNHKHNLDTGKVKIHGLHDGKFLASSGSLESWPRDMCLMDAMTICVIHRDGLIKMMSIDSTDMSRYIKTTKTIRLQGVLLAEYHGVVRFKDSLVVTGGKQGMMYWCIVSLKDGHVDRIHQICKGYVWCQCRVTTKDNIIYISCHAGDESPDTGVYGFNILNPSQCKYKYKHQRLQEPTSIVINEDGDIFVCDHGFLDSCIHQLTASCQLVAIFTQGIPLRALFWDNGHLYGTCRWSRDITVFSHMYQGSHKASEVLVSDERKQPVIEETAIQIGQGNVPVDKDQSSEEMDTHSSVQSPMDYGDDKQGNLTEERICHLLSSESDLKDYISNDPPEACIKTLMSQASKLSSKESMKIILHFIVQEFTEKFSDKHIRIWAGEEVIGPTHVQTVLVCFYSGSCDMSVESFYDLKVIYRDYNTTDGESAAARVHERDKKVVLTIEHCDLVNEAITLHGEDLFAKHSNLEAISSGGILSSMSRGFVQEPCVILYCRVKGIIPFGETPFPKRLKVNEEGSITVDVREGYFSSHADSQNSDQENRLHQEPLRMGCSIGPAGRRESGTVGPFVKINSDRLGFLTCAHVVFSNSELIDLANMTQADLRVREIVQPPDGDLYASQYQYDHRLCGRVFNAMFRGDWSPTSAEKFGIDAAVIEITSRKPDAGVFVPIDDLQLEDAGFSKDQPPKFDTGEIMPHPINRKIQRAVIKVGSETGLTRGLLRLTKGMVRYSTSTGTMKRDNDRQVELKMTMHGLMEISPASCNNNEFCKCGDSGSGVFLVDDDDNNNKLICIGLSFGVVSDGTGIAMPIDKILTALHRDDGLQIKLKDFVNKAAV